MPANRLQGSATPPDVLPALERSQLPAATPHTHFVTPSRQRLEQQRQNLEQGKAVVAAVGDNVSKARRRHVVAVHGVRPAGGKAAGVVAHAKHHLRQRGQAARARTAVSPFSRREAP
jgi:hypothetical protein